MSHRRSSRPFTILSGAVLTLALIASAALPAAATVVPKKYSITVLPPTVGAGSTTAFQVTIKNLSTVPLGAVNLHVPPPLVINSVSSPIGTWTLAGHGKNVQYRNLSLAPSTSFTSTVTASAPCDNGTFTWTVMARQGNDFTGATFGLNATGSSRTTTVTGSCHLAFVSTNQPNDAHPNDTITNADFNTGGGPVEVEVLDGLNNVIPVNVPIALVIGNNPGSPLGTLGGTTTETSSAGIASYADLSIDQTGIGYTLVASNGTYGAATSDPFTIATVGVVCDPFEPCSGDISGDGTSATISSPGGGVITMSLLDDGLDCEGYDAHSSTLEFAAEGSTANKEVTLSIDSGLPYGGDLGDPASGFEVCYQSDTTFIDKDGDPVNVGLLPDCADESPTAPCVESRTSDGSLVFITFLAPAGDPRGRI